MSCSENAARAAKAADPAAHPSPGDALVPSAFLPARLFAQHRLLAQQFIRFCCVGVTGLAIDIATVYALRAALGLIGAGMVAYVIAATGTWAMNRHWTFRGQNSGPAHYQWLRFLLANLLGFVLNRGTYTMLILTLPVAAAQPVIAIAAGSLAGLFVNFSLSRRVVFR
jgi:putative flippase GtrA